MKKEQFHVKYASEEYIKNVNLGKLIWENHRG